MKSRISRKSIVFAALSCLLFASIGISRAIVDGNFNVVNTVLTNSVKGTNIALGQYSSTHQTNTNPAIDMTKYRGGAIQVTINSGTGKWYIVPQSSTSTAGTFAPVYLQTATGTNAAFGLMSTTATRSFQVTGLRDLAFKVVPTLASGSSNATIAFTPSND